MEKIEAYLQKNNIDIDDYKLTPDLLTLNKDGDIIKWGFDIPQPIITDLDEEQTEEEKEKRKDKKRLKEKLNDLQKNKMVVLTKKQFNDLKDKNELDIGYQFIVKDSNESKLYIVVDNKPLKTFPNII